MSVICRSLACLHTGILTDCFEGFRGLALASFLANLLGSWPKSRFVHIHTKVCVSAVLLLARLNQRRCSRSHAPHSGCQSKLSELQLEAVFCLHCYMLQWGSGWNVCKLVFMFVFIFWKFWHENVALVRSIYLWWTQVDALSLAIKYFRIVMMLKLSAVSANVNDSWQNSVVFLFWFYDIVLILGLILLSTFNISTTAINAFPLCKSQRKFSKEPFSKTLNPNAKNSPAHWILPLYIYTYIHIRRQKVYYFCLQKCK